MKAEGDINFWTWLSHIRLSRLLLVFVPCFVIVPILTYWFLTNSVETFPHLDRDSADVARKVLGLIEFNHLSGPELKHRIDELLRIKGSVQNELQKLETKRQAILADLAGMTNTRESLKNEVLREQKKLDSLKASIEQIRLYQQELMERNTPDVKAALPLIPDKLDLKRRNPGVVENICDMETCFDYSRCSITSNMPVYVYPSQSKVRPILISALISSKNIVANPNLACLFIHVIDQSEASSSDKPSDLAYWGGDGRNHVLILEDGQNDAKLDGTGRAMIIKSGADVLTFRQNFDLILPPLDRPGAPVWQISPNLIPITRTYLLHFYGEWNKQQLDNNKIYNSIIQNLQNIDDGKTSDKFWIKFSCDDTKDETELVVPAGDWFLCDNYQERKKIQEDSTFSLILAPSDVSIISSRSIQLRLYEALSSGSIPVILGTRVQLPYAQYIDWSKLAVQLPLARVTELHFLLRSISYSDLFNMKRQGRLVFENYFSSGLTMMKTMLAVIQTRLSIPPLPVQDTSSPSVFNSSFTPLLLDILPMDVEPEESLGPLESSFPSPSFRRNFTSLLSERTDNWNSKFHALTLYPSTPWEHVLPTEAKFLGARMGFRPICDGSGGSGKEFSTALGGNQPQEQFTVVMLTYEREPVLINSLSRLNALPYLNKVIVVWNSPRPPSEDLRWPDIGVPIEVVKVEKNSLNNRFLPFSAIQTDAVLSVDDDSHLRHDEIIFGFRVWRENRDRLVGFPGRFHSWDKNHTSWNYNSNYSCELSMVLTGAAFYHKYYNYLYTNSMPDPIRLMVDELMNCEDLAMNFLISHVTRQPPVKVTSRWTFRCPGCPVSLSEDDSHFQERHRCINEFSRLYGYNPLLYTQYRADSVLFKTRIPPDKQKCFKFI